MDETCSLSLLMLQDSTDTGSMLLDCIANLTDEQRRDAAQKQRRVMNGRVMNGGGTANGTIPNGERRKNLENDKGISPIRPKLPTRRRLSRVLTRSRVMFMQNASLANFHARRKPVSLQDLGVLVYRSFRLDVGSSIVGPMLITWLCAIYGNAVLIALFFYNYQVSEGRERGRGESG